MEAATQFCWFMSLASLETPIPNLSTFLSPLAKTNIFGEVAAPGRQTLSLLVLYFPFRGRRLTVNRRAAMPISKNSN